METEERVSRLIRNTYRTLMSRGMKSCWVFACDPGLQAYLRERLEPPGTYCARILPQISKDLLICPDPNNWNRS